MGFFDRIDQRADVMARMAATLDVDFAAALAQRPDCVQGYRQAVLRCTFCPHDSKCGAWMQDHAQAEAAPDYCRNKDIFESLAAP